MLNSLIRANQFSSSKSFLKGLMFRKKLSSSAMMAMRTTTIDGTNNNFSINTNTLKDLSEKYLESELIRLQQAKKRQGKNKGISSLSLLEDEDDEYFQQESKSKSSSTSSPSSTTTTTLVDPLLQTREATEAYSKFLKLNLMGPICKALVHHLKFTEPTEIQNSTIPKGLKKHNIVASAKTGTGKTAAYSLPIIQKIITERTRHRLAPATDKQIYSLILCPTKELAEQVYEHINSYVNYTLQVMKQEERIDDSFEFKTGLIFGGASKITQLKTISKGLDILIATPGRLVELLKGDDSFKLNTVRYLVLDECDRMLNMGFLPELKFIYNHLPKPNNQKDSEMQVFMFSATLTKDVEDLICRFAPTHALFNLNQEFTIPEKIKHIKYFVSKKEMKFKLLLYLLKRKGSLRDKKVLIFCRTREKVERLAQNLANRGYRAIGIHKEKSLAFRTNSIKSFSSQEEDECQILIATDVLARGIDVPDLPCVINYDVPAKPEDYVHRVGRTGRAGNEGLAFSFISKTPILIKIGGRLVELNEEHFIKSVEQFISQKVEHRKVPGPWNDTAMDNLDNELKRVEEVSKKKALEILSNKQKKSEQKKQSEEDAKMVSAFSESFNKIKQKVEQTKTLTESDLKYAPTLRHFKQGRYEDVMKEFEVKRAIKEGAIKRVHTNSKSKSKKKKKFIYQL